MPLGAAQPLACQLRSGECRCCCCCRCCKELTASDHGKIPERRCRCSCTLTHSVSPPPNGKECELVARWAAHLTAYCCSVFFFAFQPPLLALSLSLLSAKASTNAHCLTDRQVFAALTRAHLCTAQQRMTRAHFTCSSRSSLQWCLVRVLCTILAADVCLRSANAYTESMSTSPRNHLMRRDESTNERTK